MTQDENKKAHIESDENWKQQAQREKEKLADEKTPQEEASAQKTTPTGPLPPANFITLINSMVLQTLHCLGRMDDPAGPRSEVNFDLAKYHIDMLQVLEEKTKNNLTDQESNALAVALHEVRMQYVHASQT